MGKLRPPRDKRTTPSYPRLEADLGLMDTLSVSDWLLPKTMAYHSSFLESGPASHEGIWKRRIHLKCQRVSRPSLHVSKGPQGTLPSSETVRKFGSAHRAAGGSPALEALVHSLAPPLHREARVTADERSRSSPRTCPWHRSRQLSSLLPDRPCWQRSRLYGSLVRHKSKHALISFS